MATPKIDAYFEEVRHLGLTAEEKARHIGDTPGLLKELLRDTVTLYTRPWQVLFKGAKFDFTRKCLWASDGQHAVVWDLRAFPDRPESYRNQQTSLGRVSLVQYKETYARGV